MTSEELIYSVARLTVENFTFRDMVVKLQQENKELREQAKDEPKEEPQSE
jgi:hypothetical protein